MSHHSFPHHRLDAYRIALALAVTTHKLAQRLPRGNGSLKDQLKRSGQAPVLLIAEGANRFSAAQKRQRFTEAQGECGETAAAAETAAALGLVPPGDAQAVQDLAARVSAMLTGLIKRFR